MHRKVSHTLQTWFVYIILASDKKLYTGVTTDVIRRWREHTSGKKGAKFFRGRKPELLVYLEQAPNRSLAQQREYQIKQLSVREKYRLIESVFIIDFHL